MKNIALCLNKFINIILLITGFIFSIFSIGRLNIFISIYIWPFCFLNYLHKNDTKILPCIIVTLCILFSNMIRWIGASGSNFFSDLFWGGYFSLINIIPFIIDTIFYNKISKCKSIFLFPLSVAFCEFLFSFSLIANVNIYAYAHREDTQYMQIASLFGCYFLSFVISLFSSILDYIINSYSKENNIIIFIYIYSFIILIIYFYGNIRLFIPDNNESFNVASTLGVSQSLYEHGNESILPIDKYIEYINSTMKRANDSKASIITYAEEGFAVEKKNKEELINKVKNLSKYYSIFTLITLDVLHDSENINSNEAILISDEGTILYNYQKQHLVPIIESDYSRKKNEVKTLETKLGKISVVICYDINFLYFMNTLSRDHIDLLLMPSWDWPEITEFHTNDAKFRAIEGGFNLIKNTCNGILLASDYKGRTLSYFIGKDYEDYFIVSTFDKKGTITLYSYISIFFNYIYLVAIICILISQVIENRYCKARRISKVIYKERLSDMCTED